MSVETTVVVAVTMAGVSLSRLFFSFVCKTEVGVLGVVAIEHREDSGMMITITGAIRRGRVSGWITIVDNRCAIAKRDTVVGIRRIVTGDITTTTTPTTTIIMAERRIRDGEVQTWMIEDAKEFPVPTAATMQMEQPGAAVIMEMLEDVVKSGESSLIDTDLAPLLLTEGDVELI